jgi:hypothetical protein
MLESEKLAVAAHLHVLLRRKTGRVTDPEWMATNAEYAKEVVRFARAQAAEEGHVELAEWADKLESALSLSQSPRRTSPPQRFVDVPLPMAEPDPEAQAQRYVRGIR